MYNSISGRDGFLEYEMILLTLHFKIEYIFNIRIPFEQLISFYTVKQILSYIEEENIKKNSNYITSNSNRYVTGFNDGLLADNVHYNESGAEFIANRYYNVLANVLE